MALLDAGLKQGPAKDDLLAELVASILPATYSAIRIAGFEALSALIRADWLSLSQLWECVSIPLNDSVVDSEPAIQESALKCVLEYAAKMSAADASFTESEESIVHPPSTEAQDWWSQNLELVHERVSDPTAAVRSLALDTLSHIPSSVLATLPNRQRISILTLALGMQQDLEPSVRAAACGVLGVFVGYESIRDVSIVPGTFKIHFNKSNVIRTPIL